MYGRADGMPSFLESVVVCDGEPLEVQYKAKKLVLYTTVDEIINNNVLGGVFHKKMPYSNNQLSGTLQCSATTLLQC